MKNFRKAAAFAVCLLVSLSAAAMPFAESSATNSGFITEEQAEEIENGTETQDAEEKMFGDYLYTVDEDGNAYITSCFSLEKEITLPVEIEGHPVTEISAKAFLENKSEKVVIPASIDYISADNPFASSVNLQEIDVDPKNEHYCSVDGVLFTKDMKKLICYPSKKSGSSYTIPEGVETLGIAALYDTSLSEINLPSTLTKAERHCLSFNANLKSVDMSGTKIEVLEAMAFVECTALADVKFSESTTEISVGAFMNCESLEKVTLPSGLLKVGQSAFQGTAMKRVRIPETVSEIGYCAFGYDKDEYAVDGFIVIGKSGTAAAIYATDTDEDNEYSNDFTFMTFYDADRMEILEELGTEEEGSYQYVVKDGEVMIASCSASDTILVVPDEINGMKVTEIFDYAFVGCPAINIILPETVKVIGNEVFSNTVEYITIPGGCTDIGGTEPFILCSSLKEIEVTEGDGEYSSQDGVLYSKDGTLLITYPAMKEDKEFKAPEGVDDIADSAFSFNPYIESIDISDVVYIGNYAFEGCSALADVKLSKELKMVGVQAFCGCSAMKSIHVYDKVEEIGDYAFGYDYDEELAAVGSSDPYSVMADFTIYTSDNSMAHKYANACGINVVLDTVQVGTKELTNTFVYTICGIAGAVVLAVIGIFAGRSAAKKKKSGKSGKDGGNESK